MKLKRDKKTQALITDFSSLKITVDVSKLPPLKLPPLKLPPLKLPPLKLPPLKLPPLKLPPLKPQLPILSNKKLIRAVDPDAESKFKNLLKNNSLIFNTLEKFRIEVNENSQNKLDIKVSNTKTAESFSFPDVEVMWIGCGKDYDYYDDMSYVDHLGNSVLLIKDRTCISVSTDVRQFSLQKGEKVVRYVSTISTIDDIEGNLRSSGFIKTNLGYYALSSFNNRDGFLPKQFVSRSLNDEYRFRLLRWTNIYPYGQVKKIKIEILSKVEDLKKDMKKDNPNLKKWFS